MYLLMEKYSTLATLKYHADTHTTCPTNNPQVQATQHRHTAHTQ